MPKMPRIYKSYTLMMAKGEDLEKHMTSFSLSFPQILSAVKIRPLQMK